MNQGDTRTSVRWWALAAAVAQLVFVLSWLVAGLWQGPRYDAVVHTISDMYAEGAPGGPFLVVVFSLCGLSVVGFALLSLRPTLRGGGWSATAGSVLLALSIFGVGDLLSAFEREACRLADPGCSAADQTANLGGQLDGALSIIGLLLLVAAGFFLASAMERTSGWHSWARPTRWATILVIALMVAAVATTAVDLGGAFERLLAAAGAAGIAALAIGVLRHRSERVTP